MTSRDAIGLSERLRKPVCLSYNAEYINAEYINAERREAATQLDALSARVKELEQDASDTELLKNTYRNDCAAAVNRATRAEQERDQAIACCDSYANENQQLHDRMEKSRQERDQWRTQAKYETDVAHAAAEEIARLKQERDEALERLKPFARDFEMNDCDDRADDDAMEVSIKDLRAASDCIRRLAAGTEKEMK